MPTHDTPVNNVIRILHLFFNGDLGGPISNLADFLRNTEPGRYQVTVCMLGKVGPCAMSLPKENVRLVALNGVNGFSMRSFLRFRKLLGTNSYDIIHNNCQTLYGSIAIALFGRNRHCIYQNHGELESTTGRFRRRLFYRTFSGIYDDLLTVCDQAARQMEASGAARRKISNISNPIDLRYYSPKTEAGEAKRIIGLRPDELAVGTAARLDRNKEVGLFLEAAKKIRESVPKVTFLIAGDGSEKPALVRLAEDLHLGDSVRFIGIRTDMPVFYRACDVFMHTAREEAFGRTLLESLAAGTPVVAARPVRGTGRDLIRESGGILEDEDRDSAGLALLTVGLLKDHHRRRALGEQGRQWLEQRKDLHVQQWVRRLESTYLRGLTADGVRAVESRVSQ